MPQVAVPIPQPQGYKAVDGYKIAFSVAGTAGLGFLAGMQYCMLMQHRQKSRLQMRDALRVPYTWTAS